MKLLASMMIFTSLIDGAFAANLIERDGRYEVNWTTGKVRFYGVGKLESGETNYRSAEQRAWADGLRAAEKDLPKVMAERLGTSDSATVEKLSKMSAATTSVTTTYFGDERVKVLLEAPMHKVAEQLSANAAGSVATDAAPESVVIQLPRGTMPTAFVKVVDEQGRELVSAGGLARAVQNGRPMNKWFKSKVDGDSSVNPSNSKVISAQATQRGVIKVQSTDWKPSYASAMVSGTAAFVVQ
jgi:hypothetical protein